MRSTSFPKTLFAFGINHKTAPVEVREKLHFRDDEIQALLAEFKEYLSECVVLSTCNRTEVYGVSESPVIDLEFFKRRLIAVKGAEGFVRDEHFFSYISCAACQQLFNVATSIDSRVIGDSQILRQLRAAYSISQQDGFAGKILNQLLQRAFKLGKTTYTETSIHDGAVSVSLAAVELAMNTFGSLRNRTMMIIGAGEMARLSTESLVLKQAGRFIFTNRTRSHAEELATSLGETYAGRTEVVDFDDFKSRLSEADIVISSTGSDDPIIFKKDLSEIDRKILLIDIAVPRDVDDAVAELPNVILRNVDDLRSILDSHHERRLKDLPKVKKMIVSEMVDFLTWYYLLPLMPEYEKTGTKPPREKTNEILQLKEFLNQNLSEIHRLAARSGTDFYDDLNSHFSLIRKLQALKAEAFGSAAV
ncbi:MAG: glutamyl-tRNA reductase [Pyrinomonadaceae bacterium]|nr:glutamyl-tRNA reductase [Pyrinomonadaceae bacterium]